MMISLLQPPSSTEENILVNLITANNVYQDEENPFMECFSYASFSHKDILYLNRYLFYFIFKKLIISGVVYTPDWNNILYTMYYGITII